MAMGAPIAVREFSSVAEMQRHAAEVKARLFAPRSAKIQALAPAVLPASQPIVEEPRAIWRAPIVSEYLPLTTVAQVNAEVLSVADVLRLVSAVTGVTRAQLLSQQRKYDVARARHIVCWLAARHGGVTLNQVGARLGGRDHTTILYGERRVTAVIAALGLDMTGGPYRQAGVLWRATWPKIDQGRNGRR